MLSIMFQNKIFFQGKPAITEVYEKKKKRFTPRIFNFSIAFQNHIVVCICWRQPRKQPLS